MDRTLKVNDIVYVTVDDIYEHENFPAQILELTAHDGVTLIGLANETISVSLGRCRHATETEKVEYFKLKLIHG